MSGGPSATSRLDAAQSGLLGEGPQRVLVANVVMGLLVRASRQDEVPGLRLSPRMATVSLLADHCLRQASRCTPGTRDVAQALTHPARASIAACRCLPSWRTSGLSLAASASSASSAAPERVAAWPMLTGMPYGPVLVFAASIAWRAAAIASWTV